MSPITTHVLDTSTGGPASAVAVALERRTASGGWETIADGITDSDGRIQNLLPSDVEFSAGDYRLTFETGRYFHMRNIACFFPTVTIAFLIADPRQHYHVPLLLSPFGYSTYRGT
jgi:5-hydroxyisourate hydrolase